VGVTGSEVWRRKRRSATATRQTDLGNASFREAGQTVGGSPPARTTCKGRGCHDRAGEVRCPQVSDCILLFRGIAGGRFHGSAYSATEQVVGKGV